MTGYTRHDLPAEITVFAGAFDSQPQVFAHLMEAAPSLDLGAVEVIRPTDPPARLGAHFQPDTAARIRQAAGDDASLVLILPAAFEGLECPLTGSYRLTPLGIFRGTVPRLIADGGTP